MSRIMLTLIDSRPVRRSNWRRANVLWIEGSPEARGSPIDASLVNAFLRELPTRDRIVALCVARNSTLTEVPDLSLLPNLEEVTLRGPRLESFAALGGVRALNSLVIFRYGDRDCSRLAHLRPDWLQLGAAAPETFDLSCRTALLQAWPKLRRFGVCSVDNLMLDACSNVALDTLENVHQLRRLDLIGCRRLRSLSFVEKCRSLEHLVLTLAPNSKLDFEPVLRSRTLKKLFLTAGAKFLLGLAARNLNLIITNGDVCYHQGASVDPQRAYYDHGERA